MTHRFSMSHSCVVGLIVGAAMIAGTAQSRAGAATGAATEWTQLANNAQLVELLRSSGLQVDNQLMQIGQLAEQIQNQLNIYSNMLQNTAQLPAHIWGEVQDDLNQLRDIVDQGQSIAFSMGNADDILKQRFKSYAELRMDPQNAQSFSSIYQTWSDTNRDTIAGTLSAANLTADQFDVEESAMRSLRNLSETSNGQMKALQVGHQIAAQQVAQMQKLRGLVSQHSTMMGTWLQSEQTEKDLAQTRRENFFAPLNRGIPEGQKMEPRW
jgi:P-type conjugative transfer protein TrbJ